MPVETYNKYLLIEKTQYRNVGVVYVGYRSYITSGLLNGMEYVGVEWHGVLYILHSEWTIERNGVCRGRMAWSTVHLTLRMEY